MTKTPERALIIFVKNILIGTVKTRLAKTKGDKAALSIYKLLLERTREVVNTLPDTSIFVYFSQSVPLKTPWTGAHLKVQHPGDLGDRLDHAFTEVLSKYKSAIVIGSDCFDLTSEIILGAFGQLEKHDAVIGPTHDGGYYLLGLKSMEKSLFQDISWSTENVFDQTVEKIKGSTLKYATLVPLNDIDTEEDWEELISRIPYLLSRI